MFIRSNLRWAVVMVVMAGLPLVPAAPASADEEKPTEIATAEEEPAEPAKVKQRNWRVRFTGAFASDDSGIIATSVTHAGTSVSISGGVGAGVNFEYRFTPRMGFEMGAMAVAGGVHVGVGKRYPYYGSGVEVGGYVPLTFALNYHPIKRSEVFDLYVGPLVATTIISNVGVGSVVGVESRVDLGLGANLGFDINLGKRSRWSINSGLKYISNVTNSGSDSRIAFDPLIWTFGFGFRF